MFPPCGSPTAITLLLNLSEFPTGSFLETMDNATYKPWVSMTLQLLQIMQQLSSFLAILELFGISEQLGIDGELHQS